jgi:hypothetical protein
LTGTREADLLNITLGIALMAAFGGLLFAVRSRDGRDVIKSGFAAQVVSLGLVALLMLAVGFVAVGVTG